MNMNKYMHPRNIYKVPPNFTEVAHYYPEFQKYVLEKPNGKLTFDFKNADGLRCLTKILLKKDFKLDVTIPEDTLIPALPLRLNYILWLEDLLDWTLERKTEIKGIDIGTGATCIYPLLAARKNGWKMLGSEINESNKKMAEENVKKNSLEHLITIVAVSSSTFLDGIVTENENIDFCMCNPPFFNSSNLEEDKKRYRKGQHQKIKNCTSGKMDEILSNGGETEFVKRIIQDSLKLRDKIRIYTSMVGHKSSVQPLLQELKRCGVTSVSQTEFCQGRTVRWAVAWTFTNSVLKVILPLAERKLFKPITWTIKSKLKFQKCAEIVPVLLFQLKISFSNIENYKRRKIWKIIAYENTWTGLRRRRREKLRNENVTPHTSHPEVLVVCKNNENDSTLNSIPSTISSNTKITNDCNMVSQKSKRKLKISYDEDYGYSKKIKRENIHVSDKKNTDSPLLQALFSIRNLKNNKLQLQILYECGEKNAAQQILQFFKNNLSQ